MSETKGNLLKKLSGIFVSHPQSCGETYLQHLRAASGYGITLMVSGLAAVIHGLLPFLFVTTASKTVEKIHADLARRKAQN